MVKRWNSTGNILKIQVHMVKIWLNPQYDRPGSHQEFFLESTCTWSKDDWSPLVWQTRISPRIFFKDSTFVWSIDNWPPSMINQDLYLGIFFKDLTYVWSKDNWLPCMTNQDLTRNFFKDSTCVWSKDDWPPIMTNQDITLKIFYRVNMHMVKRWFIPPEWQTRMSPRIFFRDSTCVWSKDEWSPQYDRPRSSA